MSVPPVVHKGTADMLVHMDDGFREAEADLLRRNGIDPDVVQLSTYERRDQAVEFDILVRGDDGNAMEAGKGYTGHSIDAIVLHDDKPGGAPTMRLRAAHVSRTLEVYP